MITISNKLYIESQNIRVFPCAYRGYYNDSNPLVFDPEARATTEANFTNTFHKLSHNKESYVIAWIPDNADNPNDIGTLKCVIGGYYFEIYNYKIEDFFDTTGGTPEPYYLCIKTEALTLSAAEIDRGRTTNILSSFAETSNYLDVQHLNEYAFTGLCISKNDTEGTARLAPFTTTVKYIEAGFSDTVTITNQYYLNAENEFVEAKGATLEAGTQLYMESIEYGVDPAKLPITNLLDVGSSNYSIRMINDITDQGTNTTVASGDYSIALGLSTAATEKASIALGNNTIASGKGAFAAGNNTEASEEGAVALGSDTTASNTNAVALGDTTQASGTNAIALGNNTMASGTNAVALGLNTTASEANQVVIGKYNDYESEEAKNQAFIIANGTATTKSNKFTVSYNGDIKALGTLETKGSIKATGSSNNDLQLGTSAEGSSGSIKVYGAAAIEVFNVTNTGTTTIAGNTSITKDTQSDSVTSGALKVTGGVGIGKNLNVGGDARIGSTVNVTGATTLNDTLTVTKAAILNNTLTVAKTTTLNDILNVNKKATFKAPVEITGNTKITADTEADSTTTGALVVTGGVGIDKKLYIGDALIVEGVTQLQKRVSIQGDTHITDSTNATSISSGALKVAGGVGIQKNLYVGGTMTIGSNTVTVTEANTTIKNDTTISGITTIENTTDYTSADGKPSAACSINGGAYIAKKLHVGGDTTFRDNLEIAEKRVAIKKDTESTAANNGALVVNGGVGIGKDLNIAGNNNIAGNLTIAGTSGKSNILQLGNESTTNKGGELKIYGTGTTTIFEVDKTGNVTAEGDLSVAGQISTGGKLTIDKTIEISATGISGLPSLTVNGTINATTFNATSDARLKTNIEEYVFKKSILDLPIKQFEYIKDKDHIKYIGCIAQDLQHICPDLVNENADGMLSIQESKLVYALMQEVKKLKQKVEQLERK